MPTYDYPGVYIEEQPAASPIQGLSLIHIPEPTRPYSISYAVFCFKKKQQQHNNTQNTK